MLPKDPIMLLSMINMKLRDTGLSFVALCEDLDVDSSDIKDKLSKIDYFYDESSNQFK